MYRTKKWCLFFVYVLCAIFVTRDTTHLLISALKLVALSNAAYINRNKKSKQFKSEMKRKGKKLRVKMLIVSTMRETYFASL